MLFENYNHGWSHYHFHYSYMYDWFVTETNSIMTTFQADFQSRQTEASDLTTFLTFTSHLTLLSWVTFRCFLVYK